MITTNAEIHCAINHWLLNTVMSEYYMQHAVHVTVCLSIVLFVIGNLLLLIVPSALYPDSSCTSESCALH